jgi:thiol-disulfide isomerase/thioredoxin
MRKMKKVIMTLAMMAVTISVMAACTNKPKAAEATEAAATEETAVTDATEATEAPAATADGDLMAPEIELPDLQGNPKKLSSLRGKYVIIDFWGSWCVWCIRGFPAMKAMYAKYKDRLEILGVDCQDSERKWRTAVEQYELPWLHVRCPDEKMQELAGMYGIEGFPTKAVVSPEGKLLKVVVGEDPGFYTYIDQLLSK